MSLTISRILHAGYLFECDGARIAFDPIFENPFSRNCHAFPDVRFHLDEVRKLDLAAVFISHFHDDHCSLESLDLLDRDTPIYLYCMFEELFAMIGALGFRHVHPLRTDDPVLVGPFTVTPREALDSDVDSMYQIEAAGLKVLNVVDSWIAPAAMAGLARSAPWDMVLWPFQTMREIEVISPMRADHSTPAIPDEWIDELRALAPRYVVPSSCQFVQEPWSWYNHAMFPISYRQFSGAVEAALPATRVVRINPSVSFVLDAQGLTGAPPLNWLLPVGDQDVDYDYRPDAVPPKTSEIARRFAPLTDAQTALVMDYCRGGLQEKYRAMELPEDSYFATPRHWRLEVYDHTGAVVHFDYRVEGDTIEPAGAGAIGWLTEVSVAKMYAALALGESLTSMYVRINDAVFDARTEEEIEAADVVDDPLIRCLFNDAFGAYQAAQLRRLTSGAQLPGDVQ